MTEPSLKQKTAKGLLWGGFSSGVQQLIAVGSGIYMARTLGVQDYGLIGMLAIFSGIAITIVNSGFSTALTNKKDAGHADYNAVFWFSLLVGLLLYVVLFFCAPLIAEFYKRPELIKLSRFHFLGFFIAAIGLVSYTVMFKKLMTKQMALIETLSLLTSITVSIILAFKGFAYWALSVQFVLHVVICTVARFIIAPWKPTLNFHFAPLKPLFAFSSKLLLTGIFTQINANVFSIIFGRFYSAHQLGIYSQGQKWMTMGNQFIGGMIGYVTQPVLVQVNEDKNRQVNVLRKLIRFGAFVSFPLMLGLAFIGREFILIAIGDKWLESIPFLQLFCVWGAFGFLSTLYVYLIYTSGKSNFYMYGTIITGLLQLAVVFCMYPFGIFPMVISYIATYFIGLAIWQWYVSKLTGLRLKDVLKDILPYLVLTIGCFFVAWLFTRSITDLYLKLGVKVVISGVLYLVILKMTPSVIFKESIDFLLKSIKK